MNGEKPLNQTEPSASAWDKLKDVEFNGQDQSKSELIGNVYQKIINNHKVKQIFAVVALTGLVIANGLSSKDVAGLQTPQDVQSIVIDAAKHSPENLAEYSSMILTNEEKDFLEIRDLAVQEIYDRITSSKEQAEKIQSSFEEVIDSSMSAPKPSLEELERKRMESMESASNSAAEVSSDHFRPPEFPHHEIPQHEIPTPPNRHDDDTPGIPEIPAVRLDDDTMDHDSRNLFRGDF